MRTLSCVLLAVVALPAMAAKPSYPDLSDKELEKLVKGQPVFRKTQQSEDEWGALLGVQRIAASKQSVWAVVLDLERMPESNPALKVASEYTSEMDRTPPGGGRFIDIHYEVEMAGDRFQYHFHYTHFAEQDYLEWVLDEEKDNDIESSIGSLSVWPVEGDPDKVDLVYFCKCVHGEQMGMKIPPWLDVLLTKNSLKDYFAFVSGAVPRQTDG